MSQQHDKAIVFIADDRYSDYARLAIKDAWDYSSGSCPIYLIHDRRLSETNRKRFLKLSNRYSIDLNLLNVSEEHLFYENVKMKYHITDIAFAKLLIADLVPKNVKYAYYIDIDVLFMQDISDLLAIEPNKSMAVVDHNEPREYVRLFGKPGRYINAGVFVANLDRWRNLQVSQRAKEVFEENKEKLVYADQDLLMLVFEEDWEDLPIEYNFMLSSRLNKYVKNLYPLDWDCRVVNPVIVHYLGPSKPWGTSGDKHTHLIWKQRYKNL